MKKLLQIISLSAICFLSFGCQELTSKTLGKMGYRNIDQVNAQIAQVKQDAQNQIAANDAKIKQEEADMQNVHNQKDQNAANNLFGAQVAFSLIPSPTRADVVINTDVDSAAAFLPSPTPDVIQNTITLVKQELDEAKTTNADLQKKLQDAQNQALALNNQIKSDQDSIKQLKVNNNQVVTITNQKVDQLQAAKDTVEKDLLDKAKEALSNKEEVQKMKEKIMWITGILSLLCIAGAIWLPVFKTECIEGAALFGFITLAVPFIQGWMLLIAGGILVVGIAIKIIVQHNTAVKTLANVTNQPPSTVAKAVAANVTNTLTNSGLSNSAPLIISTVPTPPNTIPPGVQVQATPFFGVNNPLGAPTVPLNNTPPSGTQP